MIKHKDSHLDHGLTAEQVDFVMQRYAERDGFFIETIELPAALGTVQCGLHGPIMGDAPVAESVVVRERRNGRAWESRCVLRMPRPTNKLTVIAGPHDGHPCVLYTAFGGPPSPQEPDDPGCKDVEASRQFWSEHALSLVEASK